MERLLKYISVSTMRKQLLFMMLLFSAVAVRAEIPNDSLTVSLITCSPGTEAYERFGHTAIRVQRPSKKLDVIYNYGMFSFNTPNFIYRFTKGETDYWLDVDHFRSFIYSYVMRNATVYEQQLNLTQAEAAALFEALNVNCLPENKMYRYNFLFDNCSTRAEDIILKNAGGQVVYDSTRIEGTFRTLIHDCTRPDPWLTFGIDLALGSRIDEPVTYKESLFLPDRLMKAFATAHVVVSDTITKSLVSKTEILVTSEKEEEETDVASFPNPITVTTCFAVLVILLSLWQYKMRLHLRWFDSLLFLLYGITGCVLFFLMFVSEHPSTYPNYSAFWLHPFHLFIVVAIWLKSAKKIVYYYHFINFAVLIMFLALWNVMPQQFNVAFIGLIIAMLMRSALYVWTEFKQRRESISLHVEEKSKR